MARVLDTKPHLVDIDLGRWGAVTQSWCHGPLHGSTAAMDEHVFMTYLGAARSISRSSGVHTVRSATRRGTVTLIPAGSEARWAIGGDLNVVHFYLSPPSLQQVADSSDLRCGNSLIERTAFEDARGSALLHMLSDCKHGNTSADRLFAGQTADLLCLHLLLTHVAEIPRTSPLCGGLSPQDYRRIEEFLESNLAVDISLQELAAVVGLSPFHFCRMFKQTTGMSPFQWRKQCRVKRAQELLLSTDQTITEIAARVGYSDPSQLASVFRSVLNIAPLQFRREHKSRRIVAASATHSGGVTASRNSA